MDGYSANIQWADIYLLYSNVINLNDIFFTLYEVMKYEENHTRIDHVQSNTGLPD